MGLCCVKKRKDYNTIFANSEYKNTFQDMMEEKYKNSPVFKKRILNYSLQPNPDGEETSAVQLDVNMK